MKISQPEKMRKNRENGKRSLEGGSWVYFVFRFFLSCHPSHTYRAVDKQIHTHNKPREISGAGQRPYKHSLATMWPAFCFVLFCCFFVFVLLKNG